MPLAHVRFLSRRQLLLAVISIGIIVAAIFYNSVAIANRPDVKSQPVISALTKVSVLDVKPSFHSIVLSGNAQAVPKYQLSLTAQVSGQVKRLHDNFKTGQRFKRDEAIAWVDPTTYQQNLAGALQAIEQAKVSVLEEQRQLKIVERDRGRAAKSHVGSALIYRTPQLKAAKAGLENAQRQLKIAERDLANTHIKVPFDALVVTRDIAPGQFVQQGQTMATIYDANTMEFKVFLPLHQWTLLNEQLTHNVDISVNITSLQGAHWQGKVDRVEQHIDVTNQQRAVVIHVDKPLNQQPQLLAGTYANVSLTLDATQPLLAVPAKSVSADGQLWYVNNKQQLMTMSADIIFQKNGLVYVKPPRIIDGQKNGETMAHYRVVATPLPSYVVKQAVDAVNLQS